MGGTKVLIEYTVQFHKLLILGYLGSATLISSDPIIKEHQNFSKH